MSMSHVVLNIPPGSQCSRPSCRSITRMRSKSGTSSSALSPQTQQVNVIRRSYGSCKLQLQFDFDSTAIRPRDEHSTTYVTTRRQWRNFKFWTPLANNTLCPPPAPATSFVKLCLLLLLLRFCHLCILGGISSINMALFYLTDKG